MVTIFDVYSISLLLISLTMFVIRYLREEPPVMPYLVIACTCAVGNYLGEQGGGVGALMLLVAASFLFLGCLFYPHLRGHRRDKPDAAPKTS
ncbi:MAG: hypothetical protein HXY21_09610 [Parvularculaceae bacterium]|nr:hypothetical protein [Parvularculaceae bacterium]